MIYLCGITNENEYDNIKELTDPIWEHVDGLIFGYDSEDRLPAAKCFQLLCKRKGEGQIITRPWTNDHDLQMNTFLREGPLKDGDWIIIRDSMERFDPEFSKKLPQLLQSFQAQGIRSIYYGGKGFAFLYNDGMVFQGSPHWGLQGAEGQSIELTSIYPEEQRRATWRIKDGEKGGRPIDNKINHEAKYAWSYGRSNHLMLGMEDRLEEYQRAEMIRRHIRSAAKQKGFDMTIEGLIQFMEWLKKENEENFKIWINTHRVWKNFYRYHLAKDKFEDIEKEEETWEYTNLVKLK